jgi:hypothetical protein
MPAVGHPSVTCRVKEVLTPFAVAVTSYWPGWDPLSMLSDCAIPLRSVVAVHVGAWLDVLRGNDGVTHRPPCDWAGEIVKVTCAPAAGSPPDFS